MTAAAGNPGAGFSGSIEIDGVTLYESEVNTLRYIPVSRSRKCLAAGQPCTFMCRPPAPSCNWASSGPQYRTCWKS